MAIIVGTVAALLDYFRGSTLFLIIKLALQGAKRWARQNFPMCQQYRQAGFSQAGCLAGSIKLKGLSWSPLKVGEADIVQRPQSGGDTVFKSEHIVLDSSLWKVITGKWTSSL